MSYSIFLFDWSTAKMMVLQYRSDHLWNSVYLSQSSNGDLMANDLMDCLKNLIGIDYEIKILDPCNCGLLLDDEHIIYDCGALDFCSRRDNQTDNAYDHVFLYSPGFGFLSSDFQFNTEIIEDIKWVTIGELQNWMTETIDDFQSSFSSSFILAYEVLKRQARNRDMFFIGYQ